MVENRQSSGKDFSGSRRPARFKTRGAPSAEVRAAYAGGVRAYSATRRHPEASDDRLLASDEPSPIDTRQTHG